jgi:2-dehydro-3-deoxyphosphogluconate aldolase/(4S)-4-hydroxy-2-oxoglutarate aldolase
MGKKTKSEIILAIKDQGVIPVFYHNDPEESYEIIQACREGGATLFEFTNRGPGAHKVFEELVNKLRSELPDAVLGVGTIADGPSASLFIQIGADFVVTPFLKKEVGRICNTKGIPWLPGCGTLTEMAQAMEWGAEIVKLFPGTLFGPKYVKAILAPCPWLQIMPTGGVSPDEENLSAWFNAGVVSVGMGSQLIRKDLIQKKDFKAITALMKQTLEIVKRIREA